MASPFRRVTAPGSVPADPEKLFEELPRPANAIQNLWSHQADAVREYMKIHASARDISLQLPTGTGKTLIGVLIAEWRRRKFGERALILCPTRQLANQFVESATAYGIGAETFVGSKAQFEMSAIQAYTRAQRVAVGTYSALFNIKPGFPEPEFLLIDDAHAAENYVRGMYSVSVNSETHADLWARAYEVLQKALPPALGERIAVGKGRPSDIEMIRATDYQDVVPDLIRVLDEGLSPGGNPELYFPWLLIRDHLLACQIFVSGQEILIRPLSPPTRTHSHFESAKQRLYMSATLPEGGELERIIGVKRVVKLEVPKAYAHRIPGRRLFLIPDLTLAPDEVLAFGSDLIQTHGKALVLCRSGREARLVSDHLKTLGIPLFDARDVEHSLDDFKSAEAGALVLAGRFEGIDLPSNHCKVILIVGRPDAGSAEDRFLLTRLGMKELLRDRISTRFTQAIGRCTRAANDQAVVVPMGQALADFCMRNENRVGMHPELIAELEVGITQSTGRTSEDMAGLAALFLSRHPDWEAIESDLRGLREAAATRAPNKASMLLSQIVENEIEFGYRMWKGDYTGAAEVGVSIIDATTDPVLKLHRAYWAYQTGAAYWHAFKTHGARQHEGLATRHFEIAIGSANLVPWYARLPVGAEPAGGGPNAGAAVEAVVELLVGLGQRGRKFEAYLAALEHGIASRISPDYEQGLEKVGRLLGWRANFPNRDGAPDSVWWIGDQAISLEAKPAEVKTGGISQRTLLQARGHIDWMRGEVPGLAHYESVITSAQTALHPLGVAHSAGLYVVGLDEIDKLAREATRFARFVRANVTDFEDSEGRAIIGRQMQADGLDPSSVAKLLLSRRADSLPVAT